MKHLKLAPLPIFILVWILSYTTGCQKNAKPESVSGYVKELGTNKAITGAKVFKIDCEGEVFGSVNCFATDTTFAGTDGSYQLEGNKGWVLASAPGYWNSEQTPVLYGNEMTTDITLAPYAWLKITLLNESGAFHFYGDYSYYLSKGQDTTFMIFTEGNKNYKYVFGAIKEMNEMPVQDSSFFKAKLDNTPIKVFMNDVAAFWVNPYIPGHDTTDLTIIY